MTELQAGDQALAFDLPTDGGGRVRLQDLKGKTVVLYLYPKDDTSGCTSEAQQFTTLAEDFKKAGAVIIGVSKDSVQSHDKFKAKYELEVILASDESGTLIEDLGSWVEKSMYGRKYMGIDRSTFLIDGSGVIRQVWRKVKVPGHADQVLKAARALKD
jgi:thioredoxin-dependent peroxiredoxin